MNLGPIAETLDKIFSALVSYRRHASFVGARKAPRCDYYVPGSPGFIVE